MGEAKPYDRWRTADGRVFNVHPDYYLASCDSCGWVGSSQECGTDHGFDDSDVYCPKCGKGYADGGKVAETATKEPPMADTPSDLTERAMDALEEMDRVIAISRSYQRAGESCAEIDPDMIRRWRMAIVPLVMRGVYVSAARAAPVPEGDASKVDADRIALLFRKYAARLRNGDSRDVVANWLDHEAAMLSAAPLPAAPGAPAAQPATLDNPCLRKLKAGEPYFVLLGRDRQAAAAVRFWADQREAERGVSEKVAAARQIADQMDAYRGDAAQPATGEV